jgi:hypothetical protein
MKKSLKISTLGVISTIFVTYMAILGLPAQAAQEKTLTEYLYNQNVSFLIVNDEKLTTFGWKSASEGCKTIKEAGFSIKTVRNYAADTRVETVSGCS